MTYRSRGRFHDFDIFDIWGGGVLFPVCIFFLVVVKEVGELRLYPTNLLPRRGGSVALFREVEDDGQSSAHDQIWRNGIGAARQEEALDAGYGKTSMLAHPEDSKTLALCLGRHPVDV